MSMSKVLVTECQFHQRFTSSFYVRISQKSKNDSQVIGHFTLLESTSVKASRKHVVEIDQECVFKPKLKLI